MRSFIQSELNDGYAQLNNTVEIRRMMMMRMRSSFIMGFSVVIGFIRICFSERIHTLIFWARLRGNHAKKGKICGEVTGLSINFHSFLALV